MHEVNPHPPERMTPERRRREVASLLARGLVRLRGHPSPPSTHPSSESAFALGFSAHQRLHSDTVNNATAESQ